MANADYTVTVRPAKPRPIAAIRVRLPVIAVPSQFAHNLNELYAALRHGAIQVGGQNIFVYDSDADGEADVQFGVGALGAFTHLGAIVYSETPRGEVATTIHWGDYSGLG